MRLFAACHRTGLVRLLAQPVSRIPFGYPRIVSGAPNRTRTDATCSTGRRAGRYTTGALSERGPLSGRASLGCVYSIVTERCVARRVWCAEPDSNRHDLSATSLSDSHVYQFHHPRVVPSGGIEPPRLCMNARFTAAPDSIAVYDGDGTQGEIRTPTPEGTGS